MNASLKTATVNEFYEWCEQNGFDPQEYGAYDEYLDDTGQDSDSAVQEHLRNVNASLKTATDWHAIGYAAYLNGESGVPTANSAVMQAIGDMPVGGGGAEIMRAYQEGWQAANAEATDMQFAGDDQSFIASVLREGK